MAESKKTPELVEQILHRLAQGETLMAVCREVGITNTTWFMWMKRDPALAEAYYNARSIGADAIADDIMEIVDNAPRDAVELAKAKLRSEMRLKLLAKWQPDKYGDKVDLRHTGADGGPVQIAHANVADLAKQMRAALGAKADAIEAPPKALPSGEDLL